MIKKFKEFFTKDSISTAFSFCIAILFYLFCTNLSPIKAFLSTCIGVISPFIYAFMLAFILAKPVDYFENKIFKNLKSKRLLSIFTVLLIVFFALYCLFTSILPQIGHSINIIVEALPAFTKQISVIATEFFIKNNLDGVITEQLTKLWQEMSAQFLLFLSSIVPSLITFTFGIGGALIKIFMVLISTIYMLMSKEILRFQIKRIVYSLFSLPTADRMCVITHRSGKIFFDFLTSKTLDSIIIAIITFIFMIFLYPDYSSLIAMIIGVTNMIPVFGPFIGAIPSVFVMLMVSPFKALILTIFIIILQQIDGNIIGPKIMGNKLGLSELWILFAITVGGKLMGVAGMLLGVPTFAVIYSIIAENMDRVLNEKQIIVDRQNFKLDTTNCKDKN